MIDKNKMEIELNYTYESLSKGSNKTIYVICDYCGESLITNKKSRLKAISILDKDACVNCKYKKREELCMIKHGVKNSAQVKEVRNKISKMSTFNDKEKIKKAVQAKYGVDHPMKNDSVKENHKNSIKNKYGVDNVSQIEGVRDKVKNTNLERFGTKEFLSSKYAREKIKTTNIEKYNVENPFQSKVIMEKARATNMIKYGATHFLKNPINAKIHGQNVLKSKIKNGTVKLFEGKTISELRDITGFSDSRFRTLINQHGYEIAIKMTPKISYLETIISEFLKSKNVSFIPHQRFEKVIADFYIPDYNLIIETDGLYWHSEKEQKDKLYHMYKKHIYDNCGIKSLFFREDEIQQKYNIVTSIINNHLNNSNKIYARKCELKEINSSTANKFFEDNHLMGKGAGKCYALIQNDRIVSAIRVKGIKGKINGNYEVSRFCNMLNTTVVGGFSRLLNFASKQLPISSITTFIDRRYGTGDYLEGLGFTKEKCYVSFKWTDGTKSWNRLKFRGDIGYSNNLFKIWDCGQQKYVKYIKNYNKR